MDAYLWLDALRVSTRYHSGGAVLIIADSLDEARTAWVEYVDALIADHDDVYSDFGNLKKSTVLTADPSRRWTVNPGADPEVLVFENAGCC